MSYQCIRQDLLTPWQVWERRLQVPMPPLIKRYTDEVLLAYDSDDAGVRAALRAIPILKEARPEIKGYSYAALQRP